MRTLLRQIARFADQLRLDAGVVITDWAPEAFEGVIDKLWQVIWLAIGSLAVALLFVNWGLGAIGESHPLIILTPLFGIAYFVVLVSVILPTQKSLRGAKLALGVDALIDIFNASTPMDKAKVKDVLKLDIEFDRLKSLATIQVLLRAVTYILVADMLTTVYFGFVWVGNHPRVVLPLLSLIIVWGVLQTPWMVGSQLYRLSHFLVFAIVVLAIYMATPAETELSRETVTDLIYDSAPFLYALFMLTVVGVGLKLTYQKHSIGMGVLTAVVLAIMWAFGPWWFSPSGSKAATPNSGGYSAGSLPGQSRVSNDTIHFAGREPGGLALGSLQPGQTLRLVYLGGRIVSNNTNGWSSPICGWPLDETMPMWKTGLPYVSEGMNTDAVYVQFSGGIHKAFSCDSDTLEIVNTTSEVQSVKLKMHDIRYWDNEGDAKFRREVVD